MLPMAEKGEHTAWQLDQDGPDAYEEYLVPPLLEPWAERMIDSVEVGPEGRVLDVGCGTGIVARRAVAELSSGGLAVGLDVNAGMLAKAAEVATGSEPEIEWRQGDAADLPFSDEQFDVVFCQQALQFCEKPAAVLAEMYRTLAPGGNTALSVWRPLEYHPGYVVLAEALEQHIGEEAGTMMRSPFPAWDGSDLRGYVQDAGFDDASVTIEVGDVRYPSAAEFVRREAASSPLANPINAVDHAVRADLVREVADRLHDYTDDDGIVFPMESYLITATR